jgi:hypothetical protein
MRKTHIGSLIGAPRGKSEGEKKRKNVPAMTRRESYYGADEMPTRNASTDEHCHHRTASRIRDKIPSHLSRQ